MKPVKWNYYWSDSKNKEFDDEIQCRQGNEMRKWKKRGFYEEEKKIKRMKEELKNKVFFKRFGKRAKKFCFFRRASKICFYLVDPASDICLFKGLSHANLKEVQIEFLCGMLCKSAKMK